MNVGMNPEDVLRKFKLREPSAGLKARVFDAMRGTWDKNGTIIEFRLATWRIAASVAASILIIAVGGAVNDAVLYRPELAKHDGSEVVDDIDIESVEGLPGLMGSKLVRSFGHGADAAGFARMRKALIRELAESAADSVENGFYRDS